MIRTIKRWAPSALLVLVVGVLAALPVKHADAATASKSCSVTSPNVYACAFTITPAIATSPGAWLVQTTGSGTLTSAVVSTSSGCSTGPVVTAGGTLINSNLGNSTHW